MSKSSSFSISIISPAIDLHGIKQLGVDAIIGIANISEKLHAKILNIPTTSSTQVEKTKEITGLV